MLPPLGGWGGLPLNPSLQHLVVMWVTPVGEEFVSFEIILLRNTECTKY